MFASVIVAMICEYCNMHHKRYRLLRWMTALILIGTALMMKSSSTFVCTVPLVIMLLVPFSAQIMSNKRLPFYLMGGYIVSWIALVIFRLQYLLDGLIEVVLHRDLTLTSRTKIWDVALNKISKQLWFGYGAQSEGNLFMISGTQNNGLFVRNSLSAHNQIIQSLYEGGIICIGFLLLFYGMSFCRERYKGSHSFYFMMAAMVMLINCLTEAPGVYGIFLAFFLGYYSKNFANIHYRTNSNSGSDTLL